MAVANLQFVSSSFLLPNNRLSSFYTHGVSIFQKPVIGMDVGCAGARKSSVFYAKRSKIGIINALPDGEVEAPSSSSQFFEKEFKFTPTFDEYVRVLESVRTDRSRISSDEGGLPGLKKISARRHASTAESAVEKRNLSISKKKLSKGKFYTEEKVRYSKDAGENAPSLKGGVSEKSGSTWTLVEEISEKKVKEKIVEGQKVGLERRSKNFNNGRNVLHKKTKDNSKVVQDGIFENKSKSQRGHEESQKLHRNFRGAEELENSMAVKNEFGRVDSRRLQITAYRAGEDLNGQIYDVHKNTNDAEEVFVDEMLENKRMNERKLKETKVYRKELKSSEEFKNTISSRDELGCRDYGKPLDFRRFNTSDKPSRGKVEAFGMGGNQHFQAIDSQERGSAKELYHKGSIRRSAKFLSDIIEAGKPNRRAPVSSGRSGRTDVAYPDVSEGEVGGVTLENRAAFRTFEVFTDVRNRPRVLRMEMEERIRNLAKWLNASDLNMPEWQFSKMIHSTKIKFSEHSILRIVQILGSFRNWRRVLQVIEWFHSRERFKYYKSRYIYTTALDVLGKARRPMEALNIFYAMRRKLSSYPDLAAYHCIAVTLGQAGLMKELFDVIDCMRAVPEKKFDLGPLQNWDPRLEPDLVVYNAVLNACVQQRQWEGAFWVLQELKVRGIRPSSTTYGLIMEVMLACGKYNLVHEFFRKLQKNSIPGALNYKVLVNTFWREGNADEAVQAVKDMERRGIVGSASLYYDLARCLCSAGRCDEALHQIKKISKVAKKPLVVTYTGLIQACVESGSIENATYIFNQMNSFCSPNVITFNIMLKSYIQHGMFEEAKSLFQRILSDSHEINGEDEFSRKVFPDKFTFNTMMEACAAASKWDDFEDFFREMIRHGYHFDEKRHMRLVFDAWRAGKKSILEITWEHLTINGRVPPPPIIKELFSMKLQEDDPGSAVSFITIHQDMETEAFSEKSWLNLLEKNTHHINSRTLTKLLHELRGVISVSARPHPVHQSLLNACKEFGSSFYGGGIHSLL
ncbi:pentatricopeptide repeat-containing protein At1g30610, chloroplastic [Phalaenopsis equestris]|uniref:pentatricopeptide repeat-containing protein At1g30610, chloroplastic n=1 Tax=Phalaenopsis equestris TaxID=78828 RepID=UPI0009E5AF4F|nr:pentatricopeptide repeat-containing protein At1g30610, chloroplastic [Phalaenopsis equestris]